MRLLGERKMFLDQPPLERQGCSGVRNLHGLKKAHMRDARSQKIGESGFASFGGVRHFNNHGPVKLGDVFEVPCLGRF